MLLRAVCHTPRADRLEHVRFQANKDAGMRLGPARRTGRARRRSTRARTVDATRPGSNITCSHVNRSTSHPRATRELYRRQSRSRALRDPWNSKLSASMTIRNAGGERTVGADEFFVGVFETAVGEGDLLTRISIPAAVRGTGDGMAGVTLGAHGTYVANAAASVAGGAWRIALGCVAAVPLRATAVEERLSGVNVDDASARAAVEGLGATLDPPSDVHASVVYRRSLAETSTVRAVLQAAQRARG